jgi:hypothetical protein
VHLRLLPHRVSTLDELLGSASWCLAPPHMLYQRVSSQCIVEHAAVWPALGASPGMQQLVCGCRCRPDLAKGPEEWNPMVAAVLVAVAGLFKYLADEYPPDLPDYDPV